MTEPTEDAPQVAAGPRTGACEAYGCKKQCVEFSLRATSKLGHKVCDCGHTQGVHAQRET